MRFEIRPYLFLTFLPAFGLILAFFGLEKKNNNNIIGPKNIAFLGLGNCLEATYFYTTVQLRNSTTLDTAHLWTYFLSVCVIFPIFFDSKMCVVNIIYSVNN